MSMFCFQCQEAAKGTGCAGARGVCGKQENTAVLQDTLIYALKGLALVAEQAAQKGVAIRGEGRVVAEGLFATITNANFDDERLASLIRQAIGVREALIERAGVERPAHDAASWSGESMQELQEKGALVGVLSTENEDARSLREFLVIGLKGLAAYVDHAAVLGYEDDAIYAFLMEALTSTTRELSVDEMAAVLMKCGDFGVQGMALLDKANTETYGHPELTKVNIGVRGNPAILVSGHDLKDLAELLEQTKGTGVDVYTHSEMLPANTYPFFKKYDNFVGNYGGSWWRQKEEFAKFNGPILMTTNCVFPSKGEYMQRLFTTGMSGMPGCTHIPDAPKGGAKDFAPVIELAKTCKPPEEIESGEIVGGFARNQVMAVADKVIEAVKSGAIKRFVVMAGCDGRQPGREYFTEVAKTLPKDTVILTAGCAKYRYNKLDLGDIGGIPRVLDAGQCNDSYSLAFIALKLKEVFGLEDINELPISYDIGWYEQKACIVLLALLSLGVKGIRLGPTLPAFLSPNVAKFVVETFDIKPIGQVEADIAAMMAGK